MNAPVLTSVAAGIAQLTLNRPAKRNALDRATIAALTAELRRCAEDPGIRLVRITGAGDVFCAGADLAEMQAQANASEAANLSDAQALAKLLAELDTMPKPTLARVNGDGYGGAIGLLAACDIVVAAQEARFAFTEVRLGIIPAVVSPFVLGKIGESAARRYFLSAETLTAAAMMDLGLVHEVVAGPQLDAACERIADALLKGAPGAQREAKALIRRVAGGARDRAAASLEAAAQLAALRVRGEAQEGFSAFFSKRKPAWQSE